jgi:hypothetical protein
MKRNSVDKPEYAAIPRDTDLISARRRFLILRSNKPSDRVQMALELGDTIREIVIAGVKRRHPDYSPAMIKMEAIRLTVGEKLFQKFCNRSNRVRR